MLTRSNNSLTIFRQMDALRQGLPKSKDNTTLKTLDIDTARQHGLTIHDAAYLELARRRGARLATFDGQLLTAAAKEKSPRNRPNSQNMIMPLQRSPPDEKR